MNNKTILALVVAMTSGCAIQAVDEGSGFDSYTEAPTPSAQQKKTSTIEFATFTNEKVAQDVLLPVNETVKPATRMFYKREVPSNTKLARQPASIASESITLVGMISEVYPTLNVVPTDSSVDLSKTYKVYANKLPFEEFLTYLENITGYQFDYSHGTISITGSTSKTINVSSLSDDEASIERLLEVVNETLGADENGTYAALVDGNTKIVMTGSPAKVKKAKDMIEDLVSESIKQVLVTVQMFNRNYGASEGLSQGRAITRNGRYASITSSKAFKIAGSYVDESGELHDVEVGMDIIVKPLIAENNNLIIKFKPKFKTINNAVGSVILNPTELSKLNQRYSALESEVVTKSGQSIDVGSAMSAMLATGVKFDSAKGKDVRNQIFWKKSSSSDLNEFNLTLTATTVESK